MGNGLVQFAGPGLQFAGTGQRREEIVSPLHALVVLDRLVGIAGIFLDASQVVAGFVFMVALLDQAGQFLPGQCGLLVFQGDQGV